MKNNILIKSKEWGHAVWLGSSKRQFVYEAVKENKAKFYRIICDYKGIRKVFVGLLSNIKVHQRKYNWNGRSLVGICKEPHEWAKRVYNEKMAAELWSSVIEIQLLKDIAGNKRILKEYKNSMKVISKENASKYPIITKDIEKVSNKSAVYFSGKGEAEDESEDEDESEYKSDVRYKFDLSKEERMVLVKMLKAQLTGLQSIKYEVDPEFLTTAKQIYDKVKKLKKS